MNQYKYKFLKLEFTNRHAEDIENTANEYGDDGWEFVDIKEMWTLTSEGYEVKQDFMIFRTVS
jgi:hypothetical protein